MLEADFMLSEVLCNDVQVRADGPLERRVEREGESLGEHLHTTGLPALLHSLAGFFASCHLERHV